MLDHDSQLKLQAYLDGELTPGEVAEVESLLERDPGARQLLNELKVVNAALCGHEDRVRLPESREFYWGKIEQAIQRGEQVTQGGDAQPWWTLWRRILVPVGAVTAMMMLMFYADHQGDGSARKARDVARVEPRALHEMETPMEGTEAVMFRDESAGLTVIWLSYQDQ